MWQLWCDVKQPSCPLLILSDIWETPVLCAKLGMPLGSIKATVLIENVLAAFEMEEILYELREHSAGLNCGIWDYSASFVNKFGKSCFTHIPLKASKTSWLEEYEDGTKSQTQLCTNILPPSQTELEMPLGGEIKYLPVPFNSPVNLVDLNRSRTWMRTCRDSAEGSSVIMEACQGFRDLFFVFQATDQTSCCPIAANMSTWRSVFCAATWTCWCRRVIGGVRWPREAWLPSCCLTTQILTPTGAR